VTAAHPEIERIVREVILRLQSTGPSGRAQGPGPEASAQTAASAPATEPEPNRPEPEIRHRVVSLAALDGRLDHAQSIRIAPGAILTPSARDELKRRGIQIRYIEPGPHRTAPPTQLLVATWHTSYCPRPLLQALGHDRDQTVTRTETPDGLATAVEAIAAAKPDSRQLALLLTDQPSLAVYLANRTDRVRSAWGLDSASTAEAIDSLGLNLLVVQPARHRLPEIVDMARAFLRRGGGGCPEALRQAMDMRTQRGPLAREERPARGNR
jgi:hypothetical protein